MTDERWKQLSMDYDNTQLTVEEFNQGWHYCDDWDGLLVGPGMAELANCGCTFADRALQALVEVARRLAEEEDAGPSDEIIDDADIKLDAEDIS